MSQVLSVRDLEVRFHTNRGAIHAVNGASFSLDAGETLGIVGESGSGKTVSVLSCLGLIPKPPGDISRGEAIFEGQDLLKLPENEMRSIRGNKIAVVFQDAMTYLNPVLTIGRQITEALELHTELDHRAAKRRAVELLDMVGIPSPSTRLRNYPHQLSGGMRQRVMIAMALSCDPAILIADEPTTALDVTIQAQILSLMRDLKRDSGLAMIWITHDLGVLAGLADRVAVMYAGRIVEEGPVDSVFEDPSHPYTIGLLKSTLLPDAQLDKRLPAIEGFPPSLDRVFVGCPFYERCDYRRDKCIRENPPPFAVGREHEAACWVDVKSRSLRQETS